MTAVGFFSAQTWSQPLGGTQEAPDLAEAMPQFPQIWRVSCLESPRPDQAERPLGSYLEGEKVLGVGVTLLWQHGVRGTPQRALLNEHTPVGSSWGTESPSPGAPTSHCDDSMDDGEDMRPEAVFRVSL